MHLASINSQEENDKLEKYIKDFGKKNTNAEQTIVYNYTFSSTNTMKTRQNHVKIINILESLYHVLSKSK